jgi:hypothetical protein
VETVINHRVIGGRQIIAGVSGGVGVDGGKSLQVSAGDADSAEKLTAAKTSRREAPVEGKIVWWWD